MLLSAGEGPASGFAVGAVPFGAEGREGPLARNIPGGGCVNEAAMLTGIAGRGPATGFAMGAVPVLFAGEGPATGFPVGSVPFGTSRVQLCAHVVTGVGPATGFAVEAVPFRGTRGSSRP